MRVVHPGPPRDLGLDELYGPPRHRIGDRPWVGVCMIASLDGSTVVEGRSGALGGATDSAVFAALRRAADIIVVGAATVRAEAYGPPRKLGQRIGVVTASGHVDVAGELFTSGAGFLITPDDAPPAPSLPGGGRVDAVRAGRGRVDLGTALRRLGRVAEPPTFVQCEGGARLNGALVAEGLVDELDLTVSPILAGGDGPRLTHGAPPSLHSFDLVHVGVDDAGGSHLFTRWVRAGLSAGRPIS